MKESTLLESIAGRGRAEVEALLAAGAPVNGSRWRRLFAPEEPTPLQAAVRASALEIVDLLLERGADPNLQTRRWMTPLALACMKGDLPVARVLVARGAHINPIRQTRHPTPIQTAAWYRNEEVVAFLLEHGANPDPVFALGVGSLVRISGSILGRLIAAGGRAPPEVEARVKEGRW